ncbi:helix-turn-helix domain-containing protein [Actinomadura verrucosospora]
MRGLFLPCVGWICMGLLPPWSPSMTEGIGVGERMIAARVMVDGCDFGPGRTLTSGEAARMLSVRRNTVVRWGNRGKLASDRAQGGIHRYGREQVEHLWYGRAAARKAGPAVSHVAGDVR